MRPRPREGEMVGSESCEEKACDAGTNRSEQGHDQEEMGTGKGRATHQVFLKVCP